MNWITLYISGKPGFKEAVLNKLAHAGRHYLPGATDSESDFLLYWIDSTYALRDFKTEIGSKLILRYRLRFSFILPEANLSTDLTTQELALVKKMSAWEAEYRHSA
ncbi:MAG: hypothetical protein KF775_13845 [Cyclobacteriaceae bacterium]|nr:hypothetical protein [Cytophagales bacterium]MBX2900732.1 hypothetical protein [Cyclobacteriaceae bacterium]